jgi:pilus assembly protein Flp/PilA
MAMRRLPIWWPAHCFSGAGSGTKEVITDVALLQVTSLVQRILVRDDEEGQGLAEYALILALIAIVAIVALLFLGTQVSDKLSVIGTQLESVAP